MLSHSKRGLVTKLESRDVQVKMCSPDQYAAATELAIAFSRSVKGSVCTIVEPEAWLGIMENISGTRFKFCNSDLRAIIGEINSDGDSEPRYCG